MEKIEEKIYDGITVLFYRGFDPVIVLEHQSNPNDKLMLIFATKDEFLSNDLSKINSNFIVMYETSEMINNNYLVEIYSRKFDKREFPWTVIAGNEIGKINNL